MQSYLTLQALNVRQVSTRGTNIGRYIGLPPKNLTKFNTENEHQFLDYNKSHNYSSKDIQCYLVIRLDEKHDASQKEAYLSDLRKLVDFLKSRYVGHPSLMYVIDTDKAGLSYICHLK